MASTKIQNLPLKAPIGAMKIPTGGFGDYSITVSSIGDFIIDAFNLATKEYVDTLILEKEDRIKLTGGYLTPISQNSSVPDTTNDVIDEVAQALLNRIEHVKDIFGNRPLHNELEGRSEVNSHPSTSISHGSGTVFSKFSSLDSNLNNINNNLIPNINNNILLKQDKIVNESNFSEESSFSSVPSTNSSFLNTSLQALVNRDEFLDVQFKKGITPTFDQAFSDKIGGYPIGAELVLSDGLTKVVNTVVNNVNNPNSNMTGWELKDSSIDVDIPSDLLNINNPKIGQRVLVRSLQKYYVYDQNITIPPNGVTVVDKWEMEVQDYYYASWFAQSEVVLDQSDGLQSGWDYATLKKSNFIFDKIFYVAQKNHTYSDGLVRKIGLQVPNNSITYFTGNASIKLIPNSEPLGYVLNFYLAENFKIYNPVVYGDVDEHTGTTDESNHCFNIVNCKNGFIFKPKAYNAWGDGLYIGTEYSSQTNKQCENLTIFEPYVAHCGRAAISVTSGKNVNIYSPTLNDIFRVYPKVGLNIEGEGVGLTKPILDGINIHGSIVSSNCDIATSVYVYDAVQGNINVTIGNVVATNCVIPVVTQLFAQNSGRVKIGDITGTAWIGALFKTTWTQRNCFLDIGNLYSINANCNGTIERFSSVVSVDIDAESQPLLNIGNVTIGDVHISDSSPTKIMHPFYFKDNTTAADGARKLDKFTIGKIHGSTLNTAFYADGQVTNNFKFDLEYINAYYLPPSRPYLYTKLKSLAIGADPFTLTVSSSYKTPLTVQKYATGTTPLRVILPSGSTINPPALGVNSGLETTVSGSSISIEWNGNNAFITSEVGTWNSY